MSRQRLKIKVLVSISEYDRFLDSLLLLLAPWQLFQDALVVTGAAVLHFVAIHLPEVVKLSSVIGPTASRVQFLTWN